MGLEETKLKLEALSDQDALGYLAHYIDQSTDTGNEEQAKIALSLCDYLNTRLPDIHEPEIYYFKANIWSTIKQIKHQDDSTIWDWEQPEILNEIYWLRCAIRSDSFSKLENIRQCQILVNTGNILSHIGRVVEAIEYRERALLLIPKFAMACANLGICFETYAKNLYDGGHSVVMFKFAYDYMMNVRDEDAIWDSLGFDDVKNQIVSRAELIEHHVDFSSLETLDLNDFSIGRSQLEKNYRNWALKNKLFINPLNDLAPHNVAAQDVLHLPNVTSEAGEPPSLIGFYNQLKQEYSSARYLLWCGVTGIDSYKQHFSDKDVLLIDTLDYPNYGLAIEQLKLSFRSAYSLFDKVAFFINEYWQLKIPENKVNFNSVWFEFKQGNKKPNINPKFTRYPNLFLRALYWLSKDFIEYDKKSDKVLGKVMEPDADKLRTIRNQLEHKYLKVHDSIWSYTNDDQLGHYKDNIAYSLTQSELSDKSLRIIKLSRAALIYLSLAVHREEQLKENKQSGLLMPIELPTYEHF